MNYIIELPKELSQIIFSNLDRDDLLNVEDAFNLKTDYEYLFRIRYTDNYIAFKKLFRTCNQMRNYKNMWEIFYIESPINDISPNLTTKMIFYKSMILKHYENYYKYVNIIEKMIDSENDHLHIDYLLLNVFKEFSSFNIELNDVDKILDLDFYNVIFILIILMESEFITLESKKKISNRMKTLIHLEDFDIFSSKNIKKLYRERWMFLDV